jgi:predicted NBD/HSP70 family sugar kinase
VAAGTDDVIYVLAGLHTGVGAIIGGRLHRGRSGAAGEVGMLAELGLRDTMANLTGAPIGRSGGGEDEAEAVLAAARDGDPEAVALVERLAARMSRGIAAMALAIDPEMIVVGGALTRTGDRLVDELRSRVRPLCLGPVRIEPSTLGDDAVGIGAVRLALDRIDETLLRVG